CSERGSIAIHSPKTSEHTALLFPSVLRLNHRLRGSGSRLFNPLLLPGSVVREEENSGHMDLGC
ncbi:hypothetical protein KIL84_004468, partial [Mauremys mutica]